MVIVVDTREQNPYSFEWVKDVSPADTVERRKLDAGDYSLAGHEHEIAIERKTHADAYGCLGRGRARFKREIERLARYRYAAIVIECDLRSFLDQPPNSALNPKAAINTLISWDVRFGVRTIFAGSRQFAEVYVYRILQRFDAACARAVIESAGADA